MSNNTKLWTAGTLKSRGWTEDLIASLLPKPQRLYRNGRRVRAWRTDDIRRAEQSESFRSLRAASAENTESIPDDAALDAASQLLEGAWNTAALPESREATLAARYHEAILRQIPAVGFVKRLRPGQSISYIEHFLHLETGTGAEPLGATLRRFVTAAPWLGANAVSPLAGKLAARYAAVLLAISARDIASFTAAQPEANMDGLLEKGAFPVQELLQHPLSYLYSVFYIPRAIRSSLKLLVALNPKDEYPEARAMQRHFILHTGGTNTGKTHAGFERLRKAKTGVYLAPLRLLALEAQERLLDLGVACSLTTGEEEDRREGDTHVAATAEKLDLSARYDVAVIDECQMIADRERGFAWTRAILGVLAPEVHLCAAPEARDLLIRIIESTGDTWEEIRHLRKTPLVCMRREIDFDDVKPGDALITFSKLGVLSVAEDLRAHGKEPAIIYGALPYSTRRRQMEGFLEGRMQYVVSTDAIGMGLEAAVPPLETAVAGFSELVLQVEHDLLEVLTEWNKMPTVAPYVKLDVSRYITLIGKVRQEGFSLTREQELRCANIPFDETEEALLELFFSFLRCFREGQPLSCPELPEGHAPTLPQLEQYCRKLDLYFSFSKAFGCPIDRDALYDKREDAAESINQILLYNLKNNIRFCARCGAALPLHQSGRLCQSCYRKISALRRPTRW